MRQGHFEPDPRSGEKPVYRLHWQPAEALSESEKRYAHFIRYLITRGHLNEQIETARS